jgi:hypothetical protein
MITTESEMEELKILVDMFAHLPSTALWVIAFFFVYKITVIGSIYGVIRFVAEKLFDWLKARKVEYKEIRPMLEGVCIKAEIDRVIAQLHRLRGKGVNIRTEYIHSQSVDWLREAIDAKIEAEQKTGDA